MDKDTAISQIYQILEKSNISVKELIKILAPTFEKSKPKKTK